MPVVDREKAPTRRNGKQGTTIFSSFGLSADGRQIRVAVRGAGDPGYGSTSKIISETAICLLQQGEDVAPAFWVPGAALKGKLVERLQMHAGLTFAVEAGY